MVGLMLAIVCPFIKFERVNKAEFCRPRQDNIKK